MKRKESQRGGIVALAGMLALNIAGRAWGEAPPPAVAAGPSSSMTRFYSGSLGSMGEFPGKLVREGPGPNEVFLVMEDGMVHALWPATEETRHVLRAADSNGADVTVDGKYYPSIGVIVVTRVAAAK
jgi:hypothetical protein